MSGQMVSFSNGSRFRVIALCLSAALFVAGGTSLLYAQNVILPEIEAPAIAAPAPQPLPTPSAAVTVQPALPSVPTALDSDVAPAAPAENLLQPLPLPEAAAAPLQATKPEDEELSAAPRVEREGAGESAQEGATPAPATPDPLVPADNATAPETAIGEPLQASLPPVTEVDTAVDAKELSIGSFGLSVMYDQEDISNLLKVLELHERKQDELQEPVAGEVQEADLLAELLRASQEGEAVPVEMNVVLPSFYVGTIMFNHPGDWSLWINGQRFTRKKMENAKLGIRIESVARHQVTFAWKPDNLVPAYQRWQDFNADPLPDDLKKKRIRRHREVPGAHIEFNKEQSEFIVSLKPNQTFTAETMQVLEGHYRLAKPATDPANGQANQGMAQGAGALAADPNATSGDAVGTERNIANELLENLQKIQSIAPTLSPPEASAGNGGNAVAAP